MTHPNEQQIEHQAFIMEAARRLIGMVRIIEHQEHRRTDKTELELSVNLTAGGTETWLITIERTASAH